MSTLNTIAGVQSSASLGAITNMFAWLTMAVGNLVKQDIAEIDFSPFVTQVGQIVHLSLP